MNLSCRPVVVLSILMLMPLFFVAWVGGFTEFTPDSWSYFELAKSVFSDGFYTFNTYRGYFSEPYSASFPLGYPVLLATAQAIFGQNPWLSVAINLVTASVSWYLIIVICRRLGISSFHALGLCATLVLFPGYLKELYTGGAMPMAIAMVLLGVRISLNRAGFLAGLFIGLSALFRFDFLPYALLILAAGSLFWPRDPALVAARLLGLPVALSPWIAYSWSHFGKVWVSDNSWVALSATPAFVLDFPAKAPITAFADPLLWLRRVIGNGNDLLWTIGSNLWQVPVVIGLFMILLVQRRKIDRVWKHRLAIAAIACGLGATPYLLTGYFDARYFSFLYLVAAFVMAAAVAATMRGSEDHRRANAIILVSLVAALIVAGVYNGAAAQCAFAVGPKEAYLADIHRKLDTCQRRDAGWTYIFKGREGIALVFRYGAVTGHRVAAIPSNFERMSAEERKAYFDSLAPYRLLDRLPDGLPCTAD
jgi:hypothetical protein